MGHNLACVFPSTKSQFGLPTFQGLYPLHQWYEFLASCFKIPSSKHQIPNKSQ
jgi:hypothetical protein